MALNFSRCAPPSQRKRRIFWATQLGCATEQDACGNDCSSAGLQVLPVYDCQPSCTNPCQQHVKGQTIATANWVQGLALNILLTDAQQASTSCGWSPGTRAGHWSESYRTDGQGIGSRLRFLKVKCTVTEMVSAVEDEVRAALSRLVRLGVAREVKVSGKYAGRNQVSVNVEIIGEDFDAVRVGLTASRLAQGWVWGAS